MKDQENYRENLPLFNCGDLASLEKETPVMHESAEKTM